ncbi:hypothetical protein [uncultured Draconibacterium sp.]|uniref:hypothetical protein n=1 Tax=uncultured Draconibacterium sp. TaxID=1573823 RepID=UPI002AA717CB|nr:hypothetical protein [uncultured Draconibacterium sp.]
MEQSYRKRIRGIDKYLQFYLTENDDYFLGLLFEDYLKSPLLDKYGLPKEFPDDEEIIPLAKGSVTRANKKGKFVRKQPEEKETVTRHIDYIRKSDGYRVEYDRTYNVYKKVLLHNYNTGLYFTINEHDQKVVVSEQLNYSQKDSMKGTHIANIFCEIFNDFEIFDENLNPAIHFNTKFDEVILPSGNLDNENSFKDLVEIGGRFTKNEDERKAYQKRLQILKEYKPDIRGKGSNGFHGYIVFGFSNLDFVILETMYAGNATYVFSTKDFETQIIKDKQTVLDNKLHKARFFHHDNWESKLRKFMDKKMKKN